MERLDPISQCGVTSLLPSSAKALIRSKKIQLPMAAFITMFRQIIGPKMQLKKLTNPDLCLATLVAFLHPIEKFQEPKP
ncbi:hypothetical protein [Phormidium sp. FACHB-322]|uniref:hypothetical protein n=1 Tax=Cyanophyceae TaxID=3028117 RepID=UPI001F5555D4|nr:hypothetical protein [Phormidium sp. FACHB-322]